MTYHLKELPLPFSSSLFDVYLLRLESQILKNNILGDSATRYNYVLKPKAKGNYPVVFHLSGYYGNGPQVFNIKTFEPHFPDQIIQATVEGRVPLALHVFVDAMTSVGGSQFINSKGCGAYGDYVQRELVSAVVESLPASQRESDWALLGSSSGGYGALAHIASPKSPFGVALAIAPDSAFELSLLPEYYRWSSILKDIPTLKALKKKWADQKWRESKSFFPVLNCIAMALCYSEGSPQQIHYPIDLHTGEVQKKEFKQWLAKDPVDFLKKANLKNKKIYLSVGRADEFNLQFGARNIHAGFNKKNKTHHYYEFDGGHYKSTQRKIEALEWLKTLWT